jgi:hypothetical protein
MCPQGCGGSSPPFGTTDNGDLARPPILPQSHGLPRASFPPLQAPRRAPRQAPRDGGSASATAGGLARGRRPRARSTAPSGLAPLTAERRPGGRRASFARESGAGLPTRHVPSSARRGPRPLGAPSTARSRWPASSTARRACPRARDRSPLEQTRRPGARATSPAACVAPHAPVSARVTRRDRPPSIPFYRVRAEGGARA